ncbi:MAG TPA: hypothetical protein VGB02_01825 [Pyrinomonadaceae bacterium]|jgi:hypothetical protein
MKANLEISGLLLLRSFKQVNGHERETASDLTSIDLLDGALFENTPLLPRVSKHW